MGFILGWSILILIGMFLAPLAKVIIVGVFQCLVYCVDPVCNVLFKFFKFIGNLKSWIKISFTVVSVIILSYYSVNYYNYRLMVLEESKRQIHIELERREQADADRENARQAWIGKLVKEEMEEIEYYGGIPNENEVYYKVMQELADYENHNRYYDEDAD